MGRKEILRYLSAAILCFFGTVGLSYMFEDTDHVYRSAFIQTIGLLIVVVYLDRRKK